MSMAINFGMEVTNKVTRSFDHVILQDHVNYFSCCITTATRPMDTKHH